MDSKFSAKNKRIISARAGYQCSYPNCGRVLIGPDIGTAGYVIIGDVAHIYPAADQGPRSIYHNPDIAISDIRNGIFLCKDHHKLIDSQQGKHYPPATLLNYRSFHERTIQFHLRELPSPLGWIDEITINNWPLSKGKQTITFSKNTLLYGTNGSGKTALIEFLAGAFSRDSLMRWQHSHFDYELQYKSPYSHTARIKSDSKTITYELDGVHSPINPHYIKVLKVTKPKGLHHSENDFVGISKYFNIEFPIFQALMQDNSLNKNSATTQGLTIEGSDETGYDLFADVGNKTLQAYSSMSHGEKVRIITDIAIMISAYYSNYFHVMLLLANIDLNILDKPMLEKYTTFLQSDNITFQTIIELPEKSDLNWMGWTAAKFSGAKHDIIIYQV